MALPQYDYSAPDGRRLEWDEVLGTATEAERLGFDSVWLADHLFLSVEKYGAPPGEYFGYDPIVALGALARATQTIALGTLVLCAQLRPARLLAKHLDTLERLAPGRLIAGIGAGWYEPEYEAAGIPFERPGTRLRQLADTVEVVKEVTAERVPVWIGGRGDRLLGVVAGHADGWNTVWALTTDDYRDRLTVLERACDGAGRDPDTIERSIGLYTLVGEDEADLRARFAHLQKVTLPGVVDGLTLDEWRRGRLVGTVEQVREQLDQWRGLGVARLICGLGALPFSMHDAGALEAVASALI